MDTELSLAGSSRAVAGLAAASFLGIAVLLAGPALTERGSLGPDQMLDFDPLYGSQHPLTDPLPTMNDPTSIVLDWPRDAAIARGLHEGRLDHWNPLVACGAPLWAEQGGPFFPIKLSFYATPSRRTYNLFLAVRAAFAALGAYLLARQRGLGYAGAFAAGATFELSGPLIYQLRFGVYSTTFILPWVILSSEILGTRRTIAAIVFAAVILGLAGNGGHPSLTFLAFGAFAVAMAAHAARVWRQPRALVTTCASAVVAVLLGAALAAPTLLPLVELMAVGSSYKTDPEFRPGSLDGVRALLPLMLFGSGWQTSALGVLGAVAAVIGIVRGGLDAPLAAVGLLGLTASSPPIGLGWVRDITYLRYVLSFYAWPLVVLPLTQAAGRGVETFSALTPRQIVMACAGSLLACGAMWLAGGVNPLPLLKSGIHLGMLMTSAAAAAVVGLGFVLRLARLSRLAGAALILAILCERLMIDLPRTRQPASTVLASPPPPAVRFLQTRMRGERARMVGLPHRVGYPVTPMLFGLADIRNFSALPVRRYLEYVRAASPIVEGGDRRAEESATSIYDLAPLLVVQQVSFARSALLDLASVRFVAVPRRGHGTPPPTLQDDPQLTLAYSDERVLIYENHAALPRARIVHDVLNVPDESAAVSWARAQGISSTHARDLGLDGLVVVEPDEDGAPLEMPRGHASPGEYARIVEGPDPDELFVEVRLESPGVLVLSDTFYPGWRAWVDGVAAPIHPANLLFRAVSVPAGTHAVRFCYRPRSLARGFLLFGASAATCLALVVLQRRNRKRQVRP